MTQYFIEEEKGSPYLHLWCEHQEDRIQAARYAKSLNLKEVTMAIFAPFDDQSVLAELSEGMVIDTVQLNVVAIGWV